MTTDRVAQAVAQDRDAPPARTLAAPARGPRPFPLEWWMPVAVFLGALVLRLYNIGSLREYWDDSTVHAVSAMAYSRTGLLGPDGWWMPPLKHLLMFASVQVFGNDLIGWHMREAVSGSLAVMLVFLIARRVFGRPFPAIAAATLLALDPLSIMMAHSTPEDLTTSALMLTAILFCLRALDEERDRDRIAAGIAIGLAASTRWWGAAPAVVMIAITAWRSRCRLRDLARDAGYYVIVPVTVYMLCYVPWLARGNTIPDLLRLQKDALSFQAGAASGSFNAGDLTTFGDPRRWFVTWMGTGMWSGSASGPTSLSLMMNDPALWVLFAPAAAYLGWISLKARKATGTLVAGTFFLLYAFFVLSPRSILLYSASAVVPLGFVSVGFAARRLLRDRAWWLLGAAVAWSLYLYPVVAAMPVSPSAYSWLLRALGVT